MSTITKPILLDETGQSINESLVAIKKAIENTETVLQGKEELQAETERLLTTIPEDYTALTEEVSKLSESIVDIREPIFDIVGLTEHSTYFSETYTGGYYDSSGNWVDSENYSNSKLNASDKSYSLGIDANSGLYVQVCVFNGEVSSKNFVKRYRTSDNNLPSYSNMLTVQKGQTIVITRAMGSDVQYMNVKTDWKGNFDFTEEAKDKILNTSKVYIKYTNGSGNDSSVARVDVWIKQVIGALRYSFVHTVKSDINSNVWRLERAYKCSVIGEDGINVTDTAEWECAIKLHGRSDFSGGFLHGNEVTTNIIFLIDGNPVNITKYTELTSVNELRIVQKSDLYDPNDSITVFSNHGREHIFTDKLTIKQSIGFTKDVVLDRSFLAMFPPLNTYTDKYYQNISFNPMDIDLSSDIIRNNCESVTLYKSSGGFWGNMTINKYPSYESGNYLLMTNNGGRAYNKCYFVCCGNNETITLGKIWKSETVYDIKVS